MKEDIIWLKQCGLSISFIRKSVLCVRKDIFKQKTVYTALIVQGWCMSRFDGSIFTHVELCNFQKYLCSSFSLLLQGVMFGFARFSVIEEFERLYIQWESKVRPVALFYTVKDPFGG